MQERGKLVRKRITLSDCHRSPLERDDRASTVDKDKLLCDKSLILGGRYGVSGLSHGMKRKRNPQNKKRKYAREKRIHEERGWCGNKIKKNNGQNT